MTSPSDEGNGGIPDAEALAGMFDNMSRMLRNNAGSVDWDAARAASIQGVDHDAAVTDADVDAVRQAAGLADLWLGQATSLGSSTTAMTATNRRAWIDDTFASWKAIVEPVADGIASAMSDLLPPTAAAPEIDDTLLESLPPELRDQMRSMISNTDFTAMARTIGAIAKSMGATMFGSQFGQSLAAMSEQVVSTSDVGVPIGTHPAVLVANVRSLAQGLGVDVNDAMLFVAMRELAFQRLYSGAPWLALQLQASLQDYASGVHIDRERIESVLGDIDPHDPESLNNLMGGNLFSATTSKKQKAALARLELLLALCEGWVTTVVTEASANRLPSAGALDEAFRRRRATGGPAEQLFAGLVGLEVRPRRIREAVTLWRAVTDKSGADARDDLWQHPDLLPSSDELDAADDFDLANRATLVADFDEQSDDQTDK